MNQQFQYDVFISHSAQDKPAVRALAEWLRWDGLRVWFKCATVAYNPGVANEVS